MNFKDLFKNVYNQLEGTSSSSQEKSSFFKCVSCGNEIRRRDIKHAMYRCPVCNYYYKLSARKRLYFLTDYESFEEFDGDFVSRNIINFPEYEEKINKARAKSNENEGVITGKATINGEICCIFVMETDYIMGSMGAVVGDKIT